MLAREEGAAGLRHAPQGRRPRDLRPIAAAVVALALCLVPATRLPADAHARLVRAQPAKGSTTPAPSVIALWFDELLDDEFNDVAVYRARPDGSPADDANLATGKPRVDPADRTHLTTPLGALVPGAYVAQYKVLSRDGHSARGRVLFHVGARD
ncbi:MAG: copper resistance protein CopC [Deltaproteobacteria bacterium]|nr:copper resistance protein CopC [Deltaproteobacteria bacterium]